MQRGFTLIETLVYLALFALVIGGLVAAAYGLFETSDRNQTKAMMQEEENFLVGKINYALSGAKQVCSASGSTLSLVKYGTAGTCSPFVPDDSFDMSGQYMRLNGNKLNNSNTTVTDLVFIETYAGGSNPDSVEAGFTISATTPTGSTISETASTTNYIQK